MLIWADPWDRASQRTGLVLQWFVRSLQEVHLQAVWVWALLKAYPGVKIQVQAIYMGGDHQE